MDIGFVILDAIWQRKQHFCTVSEIVHSAKISWCTELSRWTTETFALLCDFQDSSNVNIDEAVVRANEAKICHWLQHKAYMFISIIHISMIYSFMLILG